MLPQIYEYSILNIKVVWHQLVFPNAICIIVCIVQVKSISGLLKIKTARENSNKIKVGIAKELGIGLSPLNTNL